MTDERSKDRRQQDVNVDFDRRVGDRRRWHRIPVRLWAESTDGDATYFNQAADLSAGGVFVAAPIPLPVGTVVGLHLDAPDGGEGGVDLKGVVVNVGDEGEPGMGVRFTDVGPETRDAIEKMVAALDD